MKNVVILGSTGSIGRNVIDIIRKNRADFNVLGLTTNKNINLLKKQIDEFRPKFVAIKTPPAKKIDFKNTEVLYGLNGICEIAKLDKTDIVVVAISGIDALLPLMSAIRAGKRIALANKESVVMAGEIIFEEKKKYNAEIIPIDSEINALFQLLLNIKKENVARLILTASGGPFLNRPITDKNIKPADALSHPTWKMGKKITIDSATMINKGFEVIEAHHFFGMDYNHIEILIHPESIVHSMVESVDGTIYAYLSPSDMRFPIFQALFYPEIKKNNLPKLNLLNYKKLNFIKPDFKKFPLIPLTYELAKKNRSYLACLVAADEAAVKLFLNHKIKFYSIYKIIKNTIENHIPLPNPDINQLIELTTRVKSFVEQNYKNLI